MKVAVWRADLVRLIAALPPEQVDGSARLLGFDAPVRREAAVPVEYPVAPPPQEPTEVVALEAAPIEVVALEAAPMPFWRLEKMTFAAASEPVPVRVEQIGGLTPDDLRSPDRSLFPTPEATPEAPLLAPWSRLWPSLRAALQTSMPGREPDVPALVYAWGRGEIVHRIPRVARQAWSPRASVWVDRSARLVPFWSDQAVVCRLLRKACGQSGLSVRLLDSRTQARAIARRGDLLTGFRPDRLTPVLVLGDLGTYGTPSEKAAWLRTARRLRRDGVRVAALVPSPAARWDPASAKAWAAMSWERGRHQGRAVAAGDPGFWEERAERLLALAAPAALVQPGLLRALRRLLPAWQADAATEADVWSHAEVRAADATGLVLDAEAAERWRNRFVSEVAPALKTQTAARIGEWHGGLPRELLRAETLVWHALSPDTAPPGDLEDALGFARRLAETARGGEGDPAFAANVRRYGRALLASMPASIYTAVPDLKVVWAAAFQGVDGVPVPADLDARALHAELGREGEPRWWAVQQEGSCLVLSPSSGGRWPSPESGRGSPVAWLLAAGAEVILTRGPAGSGKQLVLKRGLSIPLTHGESMVLRTDCSEVTVSPWRREPWAVAAGRDQVGLWAYTEVKGVALRFRWIPPGRFRMGSPESEVGRQDNEGPQHTVTWTEGRWLADAPVTQTLWEAVMGENPSRFPGADRPVERVSWDDCKVFLGRLHKLAPALAARMPTEAEWEYACRAGTKTATWLGDDTSLRESIAWYGKNAGGETHPVRSKDPNPLGLYDMLGNVHEWCEDIRGDYSADDLVDPLANANADSGSTRVFRGGSWGGFARFVRAAYRNADSPEIAGDYLGFRLARKQERSEWEEDRFGLFQSFAVGKVVHRMRWIRPGKFRMGSPKGEAGRYHDEGQHEVELSSGYWLGETPCTQALWQAVMGTNPSRFVSANRPVEQVSWDDCKSFVVRLNELVPGLGARLPTEAEWEYACRGGTTGATWVGELAIRGDNDAPQLDAVAWYSGNSGHGFELPEGDDSSKWPSKQYPHTRAGTRSVRGKLPNPVGLFDMLGNVYEWCEDWNGPYDSASVVDPRGPVSGSGRVLRGGSWHSRARDVRAAARGASSPGYVNVSLGFRLARGQEAQESSPGAEPPKAGERSRRP